MRKQLFTQHGFCFWRWGYYSSFHKHIVFHNGFNCKVLPIILLSAGFITSVSRCGEVIDAGDNYGFQ